MKKIAPQNRNLSSTRVYTRKQEVSEPTALASNLLDHWLIVKPWWRRIVAATMIAVLAAFIVTEFIWSHWYQASAMIRPASQQGPVSPLALMLGNSSFSAALGNMISSSTGLSEQLPSDAGEYIDLMQSHDLTSTIVLRHKLGPILEQKSALRQVLDPVLHLKDAVIGLFVSKTPSSEEDRQWQWFEQMQKRFTVEYDNMQGNVTLTFTDRDPDTATKILGFYIDDLREKLRKRTIDNTGAAVRSLQEALEQTPDPLVQQQLALIIAQEIQQEKTAQAEADFAFSVTDAPFVPRDTFQPNVLLVCLVAGLVVPFLALVWLELYANVVLPFREADRAQHISMVNGFDESAAPVNGFDDSAPASLIEEPRSNP
jgi:hypothetical protein